MYQVEISTSSIAVGGYHEPCVENDLFSLLETMMQEMNVEMEIMPIRMFHFDE